MIVDARSLTSREIYVRMRDLLADHIGKDVLIEVLIDASSETKKVRAFAAMSGCQCVIEKKEGYYVVRITGNVCCA